MRARKLGSLLLAVALIVVMASPVLVVPVKAADDYNPWTDISEVCTVNDSGTNYFSFYDKTTITLSSGFTSIVGQIDMIWYCGYGAPESVYLWRSNSASTRLALNIDHIGNSYYRIYGNVWNYIMKDYKFDIDCGDGAGYRSYEIKSCRIAESVALYDLDISYNFSASAANAVVDYFETSLWVNSFSANGDGTAIRYDWEIWTDEWEAYDYIDVVLSTSYASISSIYVDHNGRYLPVEVSYIYSDTPSYSESNSGIHYTPSQPHVSVVLHIDLSALAPTAYDPPVIHVTGRWNSDIGAGLGVSSCVGYIQTAERTGVHYWFSKGTSYLTGKFVQLLSALDPENVDSEVYKQVAAEQREQLDSLNHAMNQVAKPDVGNINMGVDSYVDPTATMYLTSSLSGLAGNGLVVKMMCIALTLALIGYILYGKK